MSIQLEQRIDLRKIGPAKWRLVGWVGRAIFFYAESGSEEAQFSVNNEILQGDLGSWRAIDNRRSLVVGFGGKAVVNPKADGKPGEVDVTFESTALAL